MLERIEKVDRRVIFLIMLVAISVPLFYPLSLPIRVSPEVEGFYNAIEGLEAGDVVYFAADYDPGSKPELDPMIKASLSHLLRKDVKLVCATLWPAGPPLVEAALQSVAVERYNRVYGQDFVNLGFKEGKENVMVQLGKSFRKVFPEDVYGTPVEELPMLGAKRPDGTWLIDRFEDVSMIVNISAGYPGTKEWVQQVRTRYDIPIVSGCTAVSAPEYYPYVSSNQLLGLLGGLSGAAEYEKLIGETGWGTVGMSAQSLGHVTVVLLILVGNIVFWINHRRRGGES